MIDRLVHRAITRTGEMGARLFARLDSFPRRVLAITLAGLALRLLYVITVERGDALSGDAWYYHEAAKALADGKGFLDPFRYKHGDPYVLIGETGGGNERFDLAPGAGGPGYETPTAGHPPVWVVILAMASLLGFDSRFAHQLVNVGVGTLTIVAVAYLGRELVSERVGLIAAALTAGYAFIWITDGLLMSESAVMTAAALTSLAALRFWRQPTIRTALIFGFVGAITILTRAEAALFLPVVAAVALLRAPLPWARRLVLYTVCGAIAVATVSPWVIRNLTAFEEPVLLSNGAGTVLIQSNCDETYYGNHIGYWSLDCGQVPELEGRLLDEAERDVIVREKALDYIGEHQKRLVSVVVPRRIGRMWAVYDPMEQIRLDGPVEDRELWVSTLGLFQYYLLAPAAIVGAWLLHRRRLPVLPLGMWPILATFTAAMAFGNTRYRAVAEITIVVFAAVAAEAAWTRIRRPADQPMAMQAPGGSS